MRSISNGHAKDPVACVVRCGGVVVLVLVVVVLVVQATTPNYLSDWLPIISGEAYTCEYVRLTVTVTVRRDQPYRITLQRTTPWRYESPVLLHYERALSSASPFVALIM